MTYLHLETTKILENFYFFWFVMLIYSFDWFRLVVGQIWLSDLNGWLLQGKGITMQTLKELVAQGIKMVSNGELPSIRAKFDKRDSEKPVAIIHPIDNALPGVLFGYELVFDEIHRREMANAEVKKDFADLMAEFGIKVVFDCGKIRKAKKKIRFAVKDREKMRRKAHRSRKGNVDITSIKNDLKSLLWLKGQEAGQPSQHQYDDEIAQLRKQLADANKKKKKKKNNI